MESLVKDDRPFTACNIEWLPYRDKEFDFVYCSHVLEHVPDPAMACAEIMRVGKRGYIETPTRTSDIILNFTGLPDHHKWHINKLGNTLVFMEWVDEEKKDTNCTHFFRCFIPTTKIHFKLSSISTDLSSSTCFCGKNNSSISYSISQETSSRRTGPLRGWPRENEATHISSFKPTN